MHRRPMVLAIAAALLVVTLTACAHDHGPQPAQTVTPAYSATSADPANSTPGEPDDRPTGATSAPGHTLVPTSSATFHPIPLGIPSPAMTPSRTISPAAP